MSDGRARVQEEQYVFPYHHIAISSETSRAQWMKWAHEYRAYVGVVTELVGRLAPRSMIDVGCGDGALLRTLVDTVPVRLGIDLSERAISFARAFDPTGEYAVADVATVDSRFDIAALVEVLEHVPDVALQPFIASVASVVSPGGHVLVTVPTDVVPVHGKHYRHYNREMLLSQIKAGAPELTLVSLSYVYRETRLSMAYLRAAHNKLWRVEVPAVEKIFSRYVQRRLRNAEASDGRHLVACFRKSSVSGTTESISA